MRHLAETDLRAWLDAITQPPRSLAELSPWLEGPLRNFFPFRGLVLGCGELVAGQLKVTHMLAVGHEDAYLRQIATTFELERRGSLRGKLLRRLGLVVRRLMVRSGRLGIKNI